jgi:hypothetical protein
VWRVAEKLYSHLFVYKVVVIKSGLGVELAASSWKLWARPPLAYDPRRAQADHTRIICLQFVVLAYDMFGTYVELVYIAG